MGAGAYFVLPFDLFVALSVTCVVSFYAHVFFDKEYHVENSRFERFSWFRRKQALHFVHHLHANTNFAVIEFFWDNQSGGDVRVMGSIDNGGFEAFVPMTESFILNSESRLVGE